MNILSRSLVFAALVLVASVPAQAQKTGSATASVNVVPAVETWSAPEGFGGAEPNASSTVTPLATAGAWSNSGTGPSLYNKGYWYYLRLNPIGTIPATAKITSVTWNWALSYKPAGLLVYLCHDTTSFCGNVTSYGSGTTTLFQNRAANKAMIFAFYVTGTGAVSPPAYGRTDQVIVNYQY